MNKKINFKLAYEEKLDLPEKKEGEALDLLPLEIHLQLCESMLNVLNENRFTCLDKSCPVSEQFEIKN